MVRIEKNRVLWHAIIWASTWLFLFLTLGRGLERFQLIIHRGIPTILAVILLVAINLKILMPTLYFKKRIVTYVLISLILFFGLIILLNAGFFLFSEYADDYLKAEVLIEQSTRDRRSSAARFGLPLLISFIGSTFIELTHYTNKKEKAVISSEKEKLETEIKFLKSQINPHFLFNVLNNIYTLTIIKSDQAPENLMRLSEMLRYMIYDSNDGRVSLQKEVDYLENYISLASLKESRGLNIKVNLNINKSGLKIAPLLFISFVENAFKHSKIEDRQNGFINITLNTNQQNLEFSVENSIPTIVSKKDKSGGIGLTNIKQRLELLYPHKHSLTVTEDKNVYSVLLKLDLT